MTLETSEEILKQEQKIARLNQNLALQRLKKRKKDTRQKIEFGGLVIKAKMDQYSKVIILGALIDAFEQLKRDTSAQKLFEAKGESAFMGFNSQF